MRRHHEKSNSLTAIAFASIILLCVAAWAATLVPRCRADERARTARCAAVLYVAEPGIRDYLEYGGHGLLVFDIDHGHQFVKRIATAGLDRQGQAAQRQGGLRQCRDQEDLHQHDQAAHVSRPGHREAALGKEIRPGLRPDVDDAGRASSSFCLRSRARSGMSCGPTMARSWRGSRPTRARTTRSPAWTARKRISPAEVAALDGRRHRLASGDPHGRSVQREHPAVHGQRPADALLRERQRAARLRDRRPDVGAKAAPGRGARASRRDRPSGTAVPATGSA